MLLLASLIGLLAAAPPAGAKVRSGTQADRYPTQLWEAFPLGRKPAASTSVVRSAAPSLALAPSPEPVGHSWGLRALTYVFALSALLVAGAFLRVLFAAVRRSEASLALVRSLPALRRPRHHRPVPPGYVVAVPAGGGEVSIVECLGEPPRVGELIQDAQLAPRQFVVVRVGRSPVAGDTRPCAFLLGV